MGITASARAGLICSAIPNRLVVSDVVLSELDSGRFKGRTNAEQFDMSEILLTFNTFGSCMSDSTSGGLAVTIVRADH